MKIEFLSFEIPKKSWANEVIKNYREKIDPFIKFEYCWIKSKAFLRKNSDECRKQQSELLKQKMSFDNYVILFDERGESMDSISFAKIVDNAVASGKKKVQFVVGGHYGVDDSFRESCQKVIKLSPLVLNQEVAVAVSLEQIYRAFTIIKNLPYHNQ